MGDRPTTPWSTNAHVVAGEPSTVLDAPDGTARSTATLVGFDAERDLAPGPLGTGSGLPALPVRRVRPSTSRAPCSATPAGGRSDRPRCRVRRQRLDARHRHLRRAPGERDVLVLASDLAPGDSGSPLVSTAGVVGRGLRHRPRSTTAWLYALSIGASLRRRPRRGRRPAC